MKTSLLILAVALSGFVQAANIDHGEHGDHGDHDYELKTCREWREAILRYREKIEHGEHVDEIHDFKHEMIPDCDGHGNFLPKQCHNFTMDDEWCPDDMPCYHFKKGQKWCGCVDRITGMPDKHSLVIGGDDLHCDGVVHPLCLPGWTYFNEHDYGHCYKFVDDKKTWAEAESYCQFVGKDLWGHLASIHCEDTYHFLQALTLEKDHDFELSWAGAHNLLAPTFWMWSDGMKFDFEDFQKEDLKFRKDSCLRINYGLNREWSSGCCTDKLPFICRSETLDWLHH